jgi:hypothetical protein
VFSTPPKKYPFVLQRGDAKKTSCLQLECNPTAITFQFEEKVLAKDLWLQRNLHSSTEKFMSFHQMGCGERIRS